MSDSVCAIVVTYNRKALLRECLKALAVQSHAPDEILVVDNASTDGTREMLCKEYPHVSVLSLPENTGGAGGFSAGIRKAYSESHEWLWLMDDDGVPDAECLAQLLSVGSEWIPYVAPDLIDENGRSHFPWWGRSAGDLVAHRGGPFNGVLLNRRVVKAVGYPIASFFIWGDEQEYLDRVENAGIVVATYRRARHAHKRTSVDFRRNRRGFYLVRNTLFRARLYSGVAGSRKLFILWCLYFALRSTVKFFLHGNLRQGCACLRGFWRGIGDDLDGPKRASCWGGVPEGPLPRENLGDPFRRGCPENGQ